MKNQIIIHSPQQANSEALAIQIKEKLGYVCIINGNAKMNYAVPKDNGKTLSMIDCIKLKISDMPEKIKGQAIFNDGNCDISLFNVAKDIDVIDIDAFRHGYKGIFFENTPMELLLKGIQMMFEGQIWYPRSVLKQFYMKTNSNNITPTDNIDLTPREKEMLSFLVKGLRNDEIAEKLCVSSHTIKSHIYNLFKKLGVPNRVQAATWAINQGLVFQ
jgi:LuxR family transcriptional regulator, positive regulator of biofilm formation